MSVWIDALAAIMQGPVGGHAHADQVEHKAPGQGHPFVLGQFAWDGQQELPGELRVLAFLAQFHAAPQLLSVRHPGGRSQGERDLGVRHVALPSEVVGLPGTGIHEPRSCAVGRRSYRASTSRAADDLGFEAVDGHRPVLCGRGGSCHPGTRTLRSNV